MEPPKNIKIDDVEYVRADSVEEMAETLDGLRYCMVRTYSAGVFAGYLESLNGKHAVLLNARRIWSWSGAASLSQLSIEGTSAPHKCKFPCVVQRVELTEVIEIIDVTKQAQKSISEVPVWKC